MVLWWYSDRIFVRAQGLGGKRAAAAIGVESGLCNLNTLRGARRWRGGGRRSGAGGASRTYTDLHGLTRTYTDEHGRARTSTDEHGLTRTYTDEHGRARDAHGTSTGRARDEHGTSTGRARDEHGTSTGRARTYTDAHRPTQDAGTQDGDFVAKPQSQRFFTTTAQRKEAPEKEGV